MSTVEVDGATLWYEVIGSGPPVIALHGGLGLDHTCFRPWLDPLADHSSLVLTDARANGRSTGTGADLTMSRLAADVDALRRHLGHDEVTLLGHSFGGFIALQYALEYGQHLACVVLCDTDATGPAMETMMAGVQRLGATPEALAAFGAPITTSEEMHEFFGAVGALYLPHSAPETAATVMRDTIFSKEGSEGGSRALEGWDVTSRLPEIECRALVVTGADDFLFPPQRAEALADGLRDAEVHVIEGSGHLPFVEQQETFVGTVRAFLDGNRGADR